VVLDGDEFVVAVGVADGDGDADGDADGDGDFVGFGLVEFDGANCTTLESEVGLLLLELPPLSPDPLPGGRALACVPVSTTAVLRATPAATSPARLISACLLTFSSFAHRLNPRASGPLPFMSS
jgi:hypothetical protein